MTNPLAAAARPFARYAAPMWWLFACTTAPAPPPAPDAEAALAAAELGLYMVEREIVADPGRLDEGQWIGEPLPGPVTVNGVPLVEGRARVTLPWGPGVVRVHRPCGDAVVAVTVGAAAVLSVPFPGCAAEETAIPLPSGARMDRWERSWGELTALRLIGVIPAGPAAPEGEEAAPARYVDRATAGVVCAFWGGRLPTTAEWRGAGGGGEPRLDPAGPLGADDPGASERFAPSGVGDLDGGVSEWVSDEAAGSPAFARVVGASWLRSESDRVVPAEARTDDIGFRCVFSSAAGPG